MKDLAKQDFLKDQAKLEFGTQIQFIEYSFDNFIELSAILGGLAALIFAFSTISPEAIFSAYIGSLITSLIFYIKFGTN
jgi:hypothetical protein|tara:strand:- start:365 stop:601 length:237 start_codon:yes stop_codon:yes gene_type:complete